MELSEFLLARIAEDEAVAQEAQGRSSYGWAGNAFTEAVELAENEGARKVATQHIERHSPTRVLADCDAKRRIVDEWLSRNTTGGWFPLACLALPYADHPDYDEEWRP